jgi:sec-independent protein translocase protein TatC
MLEYKMPEEKIDGFWGHVAELTKRMKAVLFTFIVATIVMLILPGNTDFLATTQNYQPLMSVFLKEIRDVTLPPDVQLIALQISDPITLYVMAALVFSVSITMPVLAYEIYKFVDPALYPHEKKAMYPFIGVVSVLFVAGAFFGYFFLFPIFIYSMFPFFTAVGAAMMFSIMDFYNILFFTIIVSGVIFTIPAFFVLLVKFGVINTGMFRKKRRYIYAGLIAAALFISPGATPQGDLVLFISLALLLEVSFFVGRSYERNNGVQAPAALKLFSNPTCKFCHKEVDGDSNFCPKCKRSVR